MDLDLAARDDDADDPQRTSVCLREFLWCFQGKESNPSAVKPVMHVVEMLLFTKRLESEWERTMYMSRIEGQELSPDKLGNCQEQQTSSDERTM